MAVIPFTPATTGRERQGATVQVRVFGVSSTPTFREVKAHRSNDVWAITPWVSPHPDESRDAWSVTHLVSGLKLNFVPLTLAVAEQIYLHVHEMNERGDQRNTAARLTMLGVRDWINAMLVSGDTQEVK